MREHSLYYKHFKEGTVGGGAARETAPASVGVGSLVHSQMYRPMVACCSTSIRVVCRVMHSFADLQNNNK